MVKKTSLREFQESLAERLRAAALTAPTKSWLGIQSGEHHWLLGLDQAGEIVPVPELTPVPLTKPWFLGLANVRGALVSVIDLSLFAGGPATPRTPETRLVLAADRWQVRAALLIDRTLGLRAVQQMQPHSAADPAAARPRWAGAEWLDGDVRRWIELDMEALVTSDEFLQAGA